ncbi:MAG: hypothetical protein C0631_16785 [Sedimenticola sp.]|nr:MAG: hypothetical protein C0631_16785 [Sedimenticola sp.]
MDGWKIAMLVFAIGMVLSVIQSIKLLKGSSKPGPEYWLKRFEQACSKQDPKAAEQALLFWGKTIYAEKAPKTLEGFAVHMQSDESRRQIRMLQDVRYKSDPPVWSSYLCRQVVGEQLRKQMPDQDPKS